MHSRAGDPFSDRSQSVSAIFKCDRKGKRRDDMMMSSFMTARRRLTTSSDRRADNGQVESNTRAHSVHGRANDPATSE